MMKVDKVAVATVAAIVGFFLAPIALGFLMSTHVIFIILFIIGIFYMGGRILYPMIYEYFEDKFK